MMIGSLFSGAGMLDVGVQSVLGGEVAWHCENNPAAAAVLEHHWPGVPNLHDITAVDWDTVEPVDILTGGWPCQPFSLAGKRKGAEDDRALWPHVARAVRMARPRLVFLENVSAVVTAGELARATASLAALGYVGSWACVRASDVGAPHRRERIFIVAADTQGGGRGPSGHSHDQVRTDDAALGAGCVAADTGHRGLTQRPRPSRWEAWQRVPVWAESRRGGPTTADANRNGSRRHAERLLGGLTPSDPAGGSGTRWGPYEPAIRRWERIVGRPAPAPTEPNSNGKPRLRPHLPEWMMGWPDGWVTQVPGISRNDQLRICGNGVVPQQAAYALRMLLGAETRTAAAS